MFDTFIVQPIFNLLVFIYAIIPGHNFGLALILFTIIIRLLLWPLVKKQLHHTKAIRALQPELKKIKKAATGDRRRESQMVMELYKERQINPFASFGILLVQAPILIGLFIGLQKLIKDPNAIINFSYSWLQDFSWLQTLASDIHRFDSSLFGLVDLTRVANGPGGMYLPALILVLVSAAVQYVQSKQLMPRSKDSRSLRSILSQAGKGKQADQQEVMEATGRTTLFIIPFIIVIVGINLASGIALYMLTSSTVALFQQSKILKVDVTEAEAVAEAATEAEADTEEKRHRRKKSKKHKARRRRR
ncbi:TPA: hypothetical protein DIS56_04115 [Candidatus Saccharibacteria bacterium]|nr:MAG: 60 kDa inner membrane insertion protein [Candidatus Saccharibacteria bacterium GW2011_GWA2_46_10]OGL36387.1 MAG: hypothetical protein A3F05_01410 [Candidatus Saccharibacteria bacterium RIFCSPHIGHO2_12_FULL_47_17]HCM52279.1 hypothetical protein [Candidatus Saccharibacteria bacterium]